MAQHENPNFVPIIIFTIIIMKREVVPEQTKKCDISWENGRLLALCNEKDLEYIPNDLDTEIEEMILENNRVRKITKKDFQRYKKLKSFKLRMAVTVWADIWTANIENDAFHESKLEYLEITGVDPQNKLIFPTTIKELRLISANQTFLTLFNIRKLKRLRIAEFYDNKIIGFPRFHPTAPLTHVDLLENPIKHFSTKNIVKYCKLVSLTINIVLVTSFSDSKDPCECPRFKEWIADKNIEGVEPNHFNCPSVQLPCKQPLLTDRMKLLYENCLNRIYDPKLDYDLLDEKNDPKGHDFDDDYDEEGHFKGLDWLKLTFWLTIILIFIILASLIIILLFILKKEGNVRRKRTEHREL